MLPKLHICFVLYNFYLPKISNVNNEGLIYEFIYVFTLSFFEVRKTLIFLKDDSLNNVFASLFKQGFEYCSYITSIGL